MVVVVLWVVVAVVVMIRRMAVVMHLGYLARMVMLDLASFCIVMILLACRVLVRRVQWLIAQTNYHFLC
jgi:hypothetical protein